MDTIRLMMKSPLPHISQEYNSEVWKIYHSVLETRLRNGSFTVLDNTHTKNKYIKDYKKLCEQYGFELIEKRFSVSIDEAKERNYYRKQYQKVPVDVIERMYEQITESFKNHNDVNII